jgi:ABC-type phosphate/phosphonate transport system substrate-binding protein
MSLCRRTLALAGIGLLGCFAALGSVKAAPPEVVQIGLVDSIFADVPQAITGIVSRTFTSVMKELTGLEGKAVAAGDAFTVGRELDEKKLHLGVFQGYEFAWAQQKYPNLRPLMVAVNYDRYLQAYLVVAKDSSFKSCTDLKGATLALPLKTSGHCRLFLERRCSSGCACNEFFKKISRPGHAEAALDQVCNDAAQVAIIDKVAWETYELVKPGSAAALRVLTKSEKFPTGVIAYRQGALDESTLATFRDGLLSAPKNARARQLMLLLGVTSFDLVPDDYAKLLANIRQAYPPPANTNKK